MKKSALAAKKGRARDEVFFPYRSDHARELDSTNAIVTLEKKRRRVTFTSFERKMALRMIEDRRRRR